jgi:hypothetical protein
MSHRHVLIGIVVAMLAAFTAGGTALAVVSPDGIVAKKHHKKKHHKKPQHKGGGIASGCSGHTVNLSDRGWGLSFNCASGTVSQFQVTTNHEIDTNPPAGAGGFTCQLTSSTSLSCSGGSVRAGGFINAHWAATGSDVANTQCKVNPGETVTVTVAGKSFEAPVSGC